MSGKGGGEGTVLATDGSADVALRDATQIFSDTGKYQVAVAPQRREDFLTPSHEEHKAGMLRVFFARP